MTRVLHTAGISNVNSVMFELVVVAGDVLYICYTSRKHVRCNFLNDE